MILRTIRVFLLALILAIFATTLFARDNKATDIIKALKINELKIKRDNLKDQIANEDKKRNAFDLDIKPERQEDLNKQQDSVCLELRSKLTAIELEINELSK